MKNTTYVSNQFKQTRDMFASATGMTESISYEEWATLPTDLKAAALFVNFYDQITLAWYKTKGEHTYEEDGVDEAMHICSKLCGLSTKQNDVMKAACGCAITAATFKPAYMFNAIRNAFSSLNYERKSTRSQYQHPDDEITVQGQYFVGSTGDEEDIFACFSNGETMQEGFERKEFWAVIENLDIKAQDAIEKLMDLDDKIRVARNELTKASAAMLKVNPEDTDAYAKAEKRKADRAADLEKRLTAREKFARTNAKLIATLQGNLASFSMA